jgi:chorismate-pyruvate lyase
MAASSKLLAPLAERYRAAGLALPPARFVAAARIPQPYRRLLAHGRDMTSALELFHGVSIQVRVLSRSRRGGRYGREVVLRAGGTGRPVEFGAIEIRLAVLPPSARRLVLAEKRPLGAILRRCGIAYLSRPTGFFRLRSDATVEAALGLRARRTLWGRTNELRDGRGRVIARIVELLPPERR